MSNLIKDNFFRLYKKAERLSAATFIVSDTMPGSEPLRTDIRRLSVELISKCVFLKDSISGSHFKNISEVESITFNLMSFLEMAFLSGLITEMNARILKEEFKSFLTMIQEYSSSLNSSVEGLFAYQQLPEKNLSLKSKNNPYSAAIFPKISSKESYEQKPEKSFKVSRKESRGKSILEFVLTKGHANIKDIAQNVKGCSEKTIQRELAKLIKNGLVKKEGERRWTVYMAAGN